MSCGRWVHFQVLRFHRQAPSRDSRNSALGITIPVTIGGAAGNCAGQYAKAHGTGCRTPGGGGAITASVPNTMAVVAPTGTPFSTAAANVPVAATLPPVLGSNSLPPTSHYNMPPACNTRAGAGIAANRPRAGLQSRALTVQRAVRDGMIAVAGVPTRAWSGNAGVQVRVSHKA
jgi:hypothetical protein